MFSHTHYHLTQNKHKLFVVVVFKTNCFNTVQINNTNNTNTDLFVNPCVIVRSVAMMLATLPERTVSALTVRHYAEDKVSLT